MTKIRDDRLWYAFWAFVILTVAGGAIVTILLVTQGV
jgi:hypothetical protein